MMVFLPNFVVSAIQQSQMPLGISEQLAQGVFLSRTDIKNAFRIIPVHPTGYNLLGMKLRDQYYFDKCMPMGCSSSCHTFELFSSTLECMAQIKLHNNHIIHLLDDLLIITASHDICQ